MNCLQHGYIQAAFYIAIKNKLTSPKTPTSDYYLFSLSTFFTPSVLSKTKWEIFKVKEQCENVV